MSAFEQEADAASVPTIKRQREFLVDAGRVALKRLRTEIHPAATADEERAFARAVTAAWTGYLVDLRAWQRANFGSIAAAGGDLDRAFREEEQRRREVMLRDFVAAARRAIGGLTPEGTHLLPRVFEKE